MKIDRGRIYEDIVVIFKDVYLKTFFEALLRQVFSYCISWGIIMYINAWATRSNPKGSFNLYHFHRFTKCMLLLNLSPFS